MKAYIMSDSHGGTRQLRAMLEHMHRVYGPADYYIHLGDGAEDFQALEYELRAVNFKAGLLGVKGNCDIIAPGVPEERVVHLGSLNVLMCHGHRYRVKSGTAILGYAAAEKGANVALYGHTHIPDTEWSGSVFTLNPGAARDGRMAVLTDDGKGGVGEIKLLDLNGFI